MKNPPPVEKKIKGLKSGAENSTAANAEAIQGKTLSVTPEGESATAEEDEGQANVEVDESEIGGNVVEDDDDWAEDMSPAAVAAREKELAKQLKGMSILGGQTDGAEEEDEDEDSPYAQLKAWILEKKPKEELEEKEVLKKAKELGIEKKHKAVLVVSEWVFEEDVLTRLPKFMKLFQTVCFP